MCVIELNRQGNAIERKEKGMKILYGRILMYHGRCCDCGMGGTCTGDVTNRSIACTLGRTIKRERYIFFCFGFIAVLWYHEKQ